MTFLRNTGVKHVWSFHRFIITCRVSLIQSHIRMEMDRILLGVLYLSGCFFCSTCVFHQYHFVNISMNWDQAQNYCRQTYTDLATIENTEELNQLISTVSSAGYNSEVWIGLYNNYTVRWTNDIGTDYLNWLNQARNDPLSSYYYSLSISNEGFVWSEASVKHQFICQNGSQLVFVNETMDWFSAWSYCRENYTDLTSYSYNQWFTNVSNLLPNGSQAWVGLFIQPYSYWSDGSSSSFSYLDNLPNQFYWFWNKAGVADLQRSGKWRFVPSGTTFPFVCYNISQVPINVNQVEQRNLKVFKLRMRSPLDLNDPAVKANILKQFQDRLEENGVSGVTLKWREQPDGKVFHKEEETDETHDEC